MIRPINPLGTTDGDDSWQLICVGPNAHSSIDVDRVKVNIAKQLEQTGRDISIRLRFAIIILLIWWVA